MKRRQSGFSMIEILVVMGIGMILIAMAVPLVSTTLNMYRLRGAGGDYANLLQTARTRAVTNDRYYPVYALPGTKAATGTFNVFVDLNGTGVYANAPLADPAVAFNPRIVIPTAAAPNTNNLNALFLPGIPGLPGSVAINPNPGWGPTFGARGLPCVATAAAGGTCSYTSGGLPIAFETFMQNNVTGIWEAVTVNPSGRVRQWQFDATANAWRALD